MTPPNELGRPADQTGRPTGHSDGGPSQSLPPATDLERDLPRCRRCHRELTTALAQAAGFGPICAMTVIGRAPRRRDVVDDGQLDLLDVEEVAVL